MEITQLNWQLIGYHILHLPAAFILALPLGLGVVFDRFEIAIVLSLLNCMTLLLF